MRELLEAARAHSDEVQARDEGDLAKLVYDEPIMTTPRSFLTAVTVGPPRTLIGGAESEPAVEIEWSTTHDNGRLEPHKSTSCPRAERNHRFFESLQRLTDKEV